MTITPSVISLFPELPPAPAKILPAVDLGHLGHSQSFLPLLLECQGFVSGCSGWFIFGVVRIIAGFAFLFSSPFSLFFFFLFASLSLSFWWEFSSAMCWSCCWIPFSQNIIKVGSVCQEHPVEFFPHLWNAAAGKGSASMGIWERSWVRQGLPGGLELLHLWSFPVELVFAGDKFRLELG